MLPPNFSHIEIGNKDYGGSEAKFCATIDDVRYLIKQPELLDKKNSSLATSYANNPISEYVGSHIFEALDLPVHQTFLGRFNDQLIVACKDFVPKDSTAQECNSYLHFCYQSGSVGRVPTYEQLYAIHDFCKDLYPIKQESIDRYWQTFVGDSLIANFDRHAGNWSYLKNKTTGEMSLAPIYDCGSSLYSRLSEDGMKSVMSSDNEIHKRIFEFPKVALNKNNNPHKIDKFSYDELLSGEFFDKNCISAFEKIMPRIDIDKINSVIENTPFINNTKKEFYSTMLTKRKELLIDKCYKKCQDKGYIKRVHSLSSPPKEKIVSSLTPAKSSKVSSKQKTR